MSGTDGGWRLPETVDPEGRLAVCICIPDEDNHIRAFWGALQELGYWFNWQRDSEKNALATSILWNALVEQAHAKFLEGVMCGTCEEFQACLEPLMAAVAALQASIDAGFTGVTNQLNTFQYGEPLDTQPGQHPSDTQNNRNQAGTSNPTCDMDILWEQCRQVVEYTTTRITDALQQAEAATGNLGFAQVLAGLPVLDEIGVDAVVLYINFMQEAVAIGYEAAITDDYKSDLACQLFCAFQNDCEITINGVFGVLTDRMREYFADLPSTFATLTDLITWFAGSALDSDILADFLLYIAWGGLDLANALMDYVGDRPLQLLLALAVNDANDDWTLLCTTCIECFNITEDNRADYEVAVVSGVGVLPSDALAQAVWITTDIPRSWLILSMGAGKLSLNAGDTLKIVFDKAVNMGDPYGQEWDTTTEENQLWVASGTSNKVFTATIATAGDFIGLNVNLGQTNNAPKLMYMRVCRA